MSDQPKPRKQDAATPTAGEQELKQRIAYLCRNYKGNTLNDIKEGK